MSELPNTQPDDTGQPGIKKIKPPSASFLSSSSERLPAVPASPNPPAVVEAPRSVGAILEGPADTVAPDSLFEPPAAPTPVEVAPVAKPEPIVEKKPDAPVAEPTTVAATADSGQAEFSATDKAAAELQELRQIIAGVEPLKFLLPRVERSVQDGLDATTMVSLYRIACRTLVDEVTQAKTAVDLQKRETDSWKSKLNRKELELAAAEAANPGAVKAPSASTGEPAVDGAKVSALQTELDKVNEQREKLLVDIRNIRDRAMKDVEIRVFREKEKFFRSFLPVLDSFERALQQMKTTSDANVIREGLEMIGKMTLEALYSEGLEPVPGTGPFDPRYHEAIGEIETDEKPDDDIFDELSRGYKVGERLIRPAMVRVARNSSGVVRLPAEAAEAPQAEEQGGEQAVQ
jgi:molecular chaperone GrpE